MVLNKLDSLVEAALVKSAQVGQMDLQPLQATFTKGPGLGEAKKPTRKIITDLVQVWWDWVCSTTKVHVVGEVEFICQEL